MTTRNPEKLSYKWVVLAASFMIRFLLFGSLYSVGVLYVTWLDEFHTSKGNTAWIGSLSTGSCLFAGMSSKVPAKICGALPGINEAAPAPIVGRDKA